jgi:hypothetical protein
MREDTRVVHMHFSADRMQMHLASVSSVTYRLIHSKPLDCCKKGDKDD